MFESIRQNSKIATESKILVVSAVGIMAHTDKENTEGEQIAFLSYTRILQYRDLVTSVVITKTNSLLNGYFWCVFTLVCVPRAVLVQEFFC